MSFLEDFWNLNPCCSSSSLQGTLIQHLKEHILHGNMTASDVIIYYTTVGQRELHCNENPLKSTSSFFILKLSTTLKVNFPSPLNNLKGIGKLGPTGHMRPINYLNRHARLEYILFIHSSSQSLVPFGVTEVLEPNPATSG